MSNVACFFIFELLRDLPLRPTIPSFQSVSDDLPLRPTIPSFRSVSDAVYLQAHLHLAKC